MKISTRRQDSGRPSNATDLLSGPGFLPNWRDAGRITKTTDLDVTQRINFDWWFWFCWFNFSFELTFRFKTFLEIIFKDGFFETYVLTVLHLVNPKLKTSGESNIHGLLERRESKQKRKFVLKKLWIFEIKLIDSIHKFFSK